VNKENIEIDICIIGGGPIGLAAALATATQLGLRVLVLESAAGSLPEFPATATTPMDSRVYALSEASRIFLERLGVWQTMVAARLQAVTSMRIWGDSDKVSHAVVTAPDLELVTPSMATIATIVEHNNLLNALWQKVREQENIDVLFAARPKTIGVGENAVFIDFTGSDQVEHRIKAKLLIGADGVNSWVRAQAGFDAVGADYSASAVVANFHCELSHGFAARQWFLGQSVLALLPLPSTLTAAVADNQVSMVWSCEHDHALNLMASANLALDVSAQHGTIAAELGELALIGVPRKFPLSRRGAAQFIKPCIALLGDAAHSVHPLAGQGANLGFGDVVALVEALAGCGKFSSIGDASVLQRYQRSRREHSLAVTLVTDGLYKLNRATNAPAQWLRHEGLQVLNQSHILKHVMMAAAAN
jgi:2-polyprenylphenol 6-hydroxylase